ncbi:MAG: XrtA system polysaccharide deacetylase [Pseudomonadota bacterium]
MLTAHGPEGGRVTNAFSVDVEEYFHATNLCGAVTAADWDRLPSTVEINTLRILEMLAMAGVTATFFVLGWVAERHPGLVRRIDRAGHEVACHGYDHRLVTSLPAGGFRRDLAQAKAIIEDIIGRPVLGYRAPSWSIPAGDPAPLQILAESGFRYDSSIMPRTLDPRGHERRFPFLARSAEGHMVEFPVSTLRLPGVNLPVAGGGYFRLFPYWFTRRALTRINHAERRPFVFYIHPWELDPAQPPVGKIPRLKTFRHYVNLSRTSGRLMRLLADFHFSSLRQVLQYGQRAEPLRIPAEDDSNRFPTLEEAATRT